MAPIVFFAFAPLAVCDSVHRVTRWRQCGPDARSGRQGRRREISRGARYRGRRQRAEDRGRGRGGGDRAHHPGDRARDDQGGAELRRREGRGRRDRAQRRSSAFSPAARRSPRLEGESTGFADPPVSVQIAELDGSNPYPEVVVSFYTGGAHCCSTTRVVTASPDGSKWTTVDLGEFDGGPLLATDLNRDGRYEFMTRDNALSLRLCLLRLLGGAAQALCDRQWRRQGRDLRPELQARACGLAQEHDRERARTRRPT